MVKRLLSFALAVLVLTAIVPGNALASSDAADAAGKLYTLGLFRGVGVSAAGTPDFALDRACTRAEAVSMFVKLIGKEAEALEGAWTTPFTDVPDWAKPYIGYAYANNLTNGVGSSSFGSGREVTASEFITLILSALGYTPETDFEWDKAWVLSDRLGITDGRYGDGAAFMRGDIAVTSFDALSARYKYSDTTLCDTLIWAGVFTEPAAMSVGLAPAVIKDGEVPTAEFAASEYERAVFNLINEERGKYGLGPLGWNGELAGIARAHSVDMSRKSYFAHLNLDGKNPADRMRAENLAFRFAGENIARGYETPEAVVAAWMASTTHRNTILSDKASSLGVGVYNRYWTVDFIG